MSIDHLMSQSHQNLVDQNDNLVDDPNHINIDDLTLRPIESTIDNPSNDLFTVIDLNKIENEFKFNTIKDFNNIADIFENLKSCDISDNQNKQHEILLLKFQISNSLKLNKICQNKSAVIVIDSIVDHKSVICWKLAGIADFFTLKSKEEFNFEEVEKLNAFVANFLAESLQNNHLGLISKLSIKSGRKSISLDLLADPRDFNLLLLAAENGNSEIVEILLHHGMNTNSLDNKVNAQTLAYQNQHFDVLYLLLQANLKFPNSFDASLCTGKCKEFCDATEEVHSLIKANDNQKLKEILNRHKNIKHFYNFSNESALKVAILSGSYDTYKELTSRKFRYASHENPAEYLHDLGVEEKRTVRDIHNNFSEGIVEKHINVLIGNSFIYHEEVDGQDKQDIISRAYKSLDSIPLVKIILKIVAASKNFKIIFDFNREAVNVADPTDESCSQGLFYVSGRIYIGAKQLLNFATEHETLANLAHELCHFTMNLVYNNAAKPYKAYDKKIIKNFQEISNICKKSDEREDIVDMVYNAYPEDVHHAELIVRPVHMLVYYKNSPEILARRKKTYSRLFDFYERKVVPELEKALPEIEYRDEKVIKKKDKKISKLRKGAIIGGMFSVIGIIAAIVFGYSSYKSAYRFKNLSIHDQKVIEMSPIMYKNVSLKFVELFPRNSKVYDRLLPVHIQQLLKPNGSPFDVSSPYKKYLDNFVEHDWRSLTEKLKEKIFNSNFIFQNESLKFGHLYEVVPKSFDSLTWQQIMDVLDGKALTVSNMIKNETKFIVDRIITDEDINLSHNSLPLNLDGVLKIANETKIFILSAEAGTGKTVTFQQFTMRIKRKISN
ncbi:uncharacterized protein [Chironomus tepperi]|uniref:uncharacterized protein n=1 Tax=Chironomus tepperi TaxID=113505 RepID=UPI00391FB98B